MKKNSAIIFFLFFISSYAQNKNKDYSKMNPKELIEELNSKEKKIIEFENKISEITKNDKYNEIKKQNTELIEIITKSNEVYLYEIFQNRYILDKNYFRDVDFDNKTTSKIKNSSVLVNSILNGNTCTSDDKIIGEKVLKLRTNYLKFIDIDKDYQNVINEKFNEINVKNLISKLDALNFDVESKLETKKNNYLGLLKNYSKFSCELRTEISTLLKNPNQENPLVKNAYESLKKNFAYKNYPYLIKTIDKVKTNYTIYVENDDLPCLENIEIKPKEAVNEVVKETQKTIEQKKE
jgi:hypothetical protein